MASQIELIPVSPQEQTNAAYGLVQYLKYIDEENESYSKLTQAHKENLAMYKKKIDEYRVVIERGKQEHDEGVSAAQMDVLFAQAKERDDA